ncbi:MAG: hypothetical protein ABH885_06095 [Candidatus Omnitrophota bacterium]
MAGFKIKGQKGLILITVIGLSTVALMIGLYISSIVAQDSHFVRRLKYSTQAQYLAEAGLSEAIVVLINNGFSAKDTASNFPLTNLAGGTYDVTVIQSGGRVILSSAGVVQSAERTAAIEVKSRYPEALEYSLATGGDVDIKTVHGDVTIKGNIHANGNMSLDDVVIQAYGGQSGKATCSGSTYTAIHSSIADTANSGPNKPMVTTPVFDFAYLKGVAQSSGTYYSGGKTFNGANITGGTAGLTYVNGDVTFKNTCRITGGFVAAGKITINNNNSCTQTQDAGNRFPIFLCTGLAKLYGLFNTEEGNIVYSTTQVKINSNGGTAVVLGAVVSGGDLFVNAHDDVAMTYFKVTASEVVSEGLEIVSWNR